LREAAHRGGPPDHPRYVLRARRGRRGAGGLIAVTIRLARPLAIALGELGAEALDRRHARRELIAPMPQLLGAARGVEGDPGRDGERLEGREVVVVELPRPVT